MNLKEKKLVGYIIVSLFFIYIISFFIGNENEKFNISLVNNNLLIIFPNKILVKDYAIKDYEEINKSNINETFEYKTIFKTEYYQEVSEIVIKDISNYNIKENHAYFYVMSQEDERNSNSKLKTLGFCLKNKEVLLKGSKEKDNDFIKKCHQIRL